MSSHTPTSWMTAPTPNMVPESAVSVLYSCRWCMLIDRTGRGEQLNVRLPKRLVGEGGGNACRHEAMQLERQCLHASCSNVKSYGCGLSEPGSRWSRRSC